MHTGPRGGEGLRSARIRGGLPEPTALVHGRASDRWGSAPRNPASGGCKSHQREGPQSTASHGGTRGRVGALLSQEGQEAPDPTYGEKTHLWGTRRPSCVSTACPAFAAPVLPMAPVSLREDPTEVPTVTREAVPRRPHPQYLATEPVLETGVSVEVVRPRRGR